MMKTFARNGALLVIGLLVALLAGCGTTKPAGPGLSPSASAPASTGPLTAEQVRAIAKEAYIYGFPMVDSYRIQYSYFINPASPEY